MATVANTGVAQAEGEKNRRYPVSQQDHAGTVYNPNVSPADLAAMQREAIARAVAAVNGMGDGGGSTVTIASFAEGRLTSTGIADSPLVLFEVDAQGRVVNRFIVNELHNGNPFAMNVIEHNVSARNGNRALEQVNSGAFTQQLDLSSGLQQGHRYVAAVMSDGMFDNTYINSGDPRYQQAFTRLQQQMGADPELLTYEAGRQRLLMAASINQNPAVKQTLNELNQMGWQEVKGRTEHALNLLSREVEGGLARGADAQTLAQRMVSRSFMEDYAGNHAGRDNTTTAVMLIDPQDLQSTGARSVMVADGNGKRGHEFAQAVTQQTQDAMTHFRGRTPSVGRDASPAAQDAPMVLSDASRSAVQQNCAAMEARLNGLLEADGRQTRVKVSFDEKTNAYQIGERGRSGVLSREDIAFLAANGEVNLSTDKTRWAIAADNISPTEKGVLGYKELEFEPKKPGLLSRIADSLPEMPGKGLLRPLARSARALPAIGVAAAIAENVFSVGEAQAAQERGELTPEQLREVVAASDQIVASSVLGMGSAISVEQQVNERLAALGVPEQYRPITTVQSFEQLAKIAADNNPTYAALLDDNAWHGKLGSLKLVLASKSDNPEAVVAMLGEIRSTNKEAAAAIASAIEKEPDKAENILAAYQHAQQQGVSAPASSGQTVAEATPPAATPTADEKSASQARS